MMIARGQKGNNILRSIGFYDMSLPNWHPYQIHIETRRLSLIHLSVLLKSQEKTHEKENAHISNSIPHLSY